MSEYMNQELRLFIYSVWSGVQLTACYDLFRIARRIYRHNSFWINAEDLLYWCFCGLYLFAGMYQENDGVIRFYALIGVVTGAVMYHFSISDMLVKGAVYCLNQMLCILRLPFAGAAKVIKRLKFAGIRVTLLLNNHWSQMKVRKAEYGETKQQKKKVKKKKKKSAE
jgi:spore cortex biosynthesis protein YabQ